MPEPGFPKGLLEAFILPLMPLIHGEREQGEKENWSMSDNESVVSLSLFTGDCALSSESQYLPELMLCTSV